MEKGNILVADDEKSQRDILKIILESEGYSVDLAFNAAQAIALFKKNNYDLILTDMKMPDNEGLNIIDDLFKISPNLCIIIMTAHGSIDSAVEAMKKGAFDYLTKPLDSDELLITIKRAIEKINLLTENKLLRQQLEDKFCFDNIIGNHRLMQDIFKVIRKVADSSVTVLILGESGTGKELIARAIHYNSSRKDKPFKAINCAAIPEALIESELFGFEKGAFTGAEIRNIGLFESAQDSTLFLDEVGDLSQNMQAKILRVIQEKEIRRLGGREEIKVNVRLVAATNKDLRSEIKEGKFREDLFYRLNVISIQMPSLRDRSTDIPALAENFIKKYNILAGKNIKGISNDALRLLIEYSWPGNVRELESTIERAVLLCEETNIGINDLPKEVRNKLTSNGRLDFEIPPEGISMEELEKNLIINALKKSDWILVKAANLLGLTYKTLQYRIDKYQIKKEE